MTCFRLLIALCAACLLAAPAPAQQTDPLVGLWGNPLSFGPKLRGEFVIRQGKQWTASIAGQRVQFVPRAGEIQFSFPSKDGFRGRLAGRSISGFWVQPTGENEDLRDPGGSGQSFATPMKLQSTRPGEWRGTVAPLDRRFTIWLSIFRGPDSKLLGAFRNPETNSNGGASRFEVTRKDDALRFEIKWDDGEIVHDAQLLHDPDRIRIPWDDLGQTVDLVRYDPAKAASFFPRLPGASAYVYRRPPDTGDGWKTARAADTGIDEKVLQQIVRERAGIDPTERPPQLMHSLLVAHHGKLVLEEYFFGYDRDTPHDMRSAGKTFGSVLLGTAPARSAGLSPASRIYEVMKSHGPFANPDPRKGQITLAHLLTHNSGLACNDNDEKSPGNEETMQNQKAQPDWWKYTLDLPMAHDPGTRYAYCSANINLVGGALTEATRAWLPDLFRTQVAEPLQFGKWHWNLMPTGEGYLGGGAFLRPRDLLKIGQMYLNGGVWNGKRIVPEAWVKESTKRWAEITPETTGLTEDEFGNYYGKGEDGLAWHLGSFSSGGRTYRTYGAGGNGGQMMIVIPDLDLVVAFTGGNYGQGGVWGRWGQQVIGDKIIPAIRKP